MPAIRGTRRTSADRERGESTMVVPAARPPPRRAADGTGDRKVFIASLWTQMRGIEAQTGGTLTDGATIEHFKAWLLRARLLTRDGFDGPESGKT
jgi:hypothetical protein